jgi:NADPH:quinone reductase-like Zn-dependent oxidoreductase
VRIRVHAAAVNPTDTGLRAGLYRDRLGERPGPYVPGADAAGVVSEVGPGTSWQVGDRVIAIVSPTGPRGGAYADQVVVPAASVVRLPAGADMVAGSTLLMNALTARLALDARGTLDGQCVAVTGAAGAFGGYVVQLAKCDSLRVIADASRADEDLVRTLGADEVVARGDDVAERIRALLPGGVDGLADGALLDAAVLPAVRDHGAVATVRGWTGPSERGIAIHPVRAFGSAERTDLLDRLREQAGDGSLTLRVARTFPADEAAEAHRLLEGGGVRGRIVLDFTS